MAKHGGDLLYKCRHCGETFTGYHAPDVSIAVVELIVSGHTPAHPKPTDGMIAGMLTSHSCRDGSIGVADFVGGQPDLKTDRALLPDQQDAARRRQRDLIIAMNAYRAGDGSIDRVKTELGEYELTGDHDHGKGSIRRGGFCPGGDCLVHEARKLIEEAEHG